MGKDEEAMDIWSKPAGMSGPDAPDYWEYFGARFVEHAGIHFAKAVSFVFGAK